MSNVNGVNTPNKRQRLTDWFEKQDIYIQEVHFKYKNTSRKEFNM